ncbi:vacuolar iron transporter homolog 5-like [Henckelia pumila]|uniref:vacuolar iron transporter homolog 5-like n=1 Tax=Henckelia pumila TaxID=405737 RepID=UPI003C6E1651
MDSAIEIKQLPTPPDHQDEFGFRKLKLLQRAQWLRAAILGANDGLLSTTSLMLGVTAAKDPDQRLVIVSGLAGALAGACSMAVGEFVSVSTQRDIQHMTSTQKPADSEAHHEISKTNKTSSNGDMEASRGASTPKSPFMKVVSSDAFLEETLPNPYKAAGASSLAFLCGSAFPLLSAMAVSHDSTIRVAVIVVVASVALVVFGGVGAFLGGSSVRVSAMRVLVGGWISMAVTYGLLKPIDKDHKGSD